MYRLLSTIYCFICKLFTARVRTCRFLLGDKGPFELGAGYPFCFLWFFFPASTHCLQVSLSSLHLMHECSWYITMSRTGFDVLMVVSHHAMISNITGKNSVLDLRWTCVMHDVGAQDMYGFRHNHDDFKHIPFQCSLIWFTVKQPVLLQVLLPFLITSNR